jgi:hypothetical protein
MQMAIAWTDFELCVKERITYYQQQYDQAIRMHLMLLKEDSDQQGFVVDILSLQQLIADELSRLHDLLIKYSPSPRVLIQDRKMVLIPPARLN